MEELSYILFWDPSTHRWRSSKLNDLTFYYSHAHHIFTWSAVIELFWWPEQIARLIERGILPPKSPLFFLDQPPQLLQINL